MKNISTVMYLAIFLFMAVCAWVLEYAGEHFLLPHQALHNVQEMISFVLWWVAFIGVLVLIPISAFRPRNKFSLSGDCRQRVKVFCWTLLAAFGFYIWGVVQVASAIG